MGEVLSVADFYCGGGGFSEGFRQMGFDIVFALDNWEVARETHKLNHPSCKHPGLDCHMETKGDIFSIHKEKINEIVDDVDVIVGSPPCVSFSMANNAGKADKSLGMKLIKKFLQIVAVKKHTPQSKLKYWLMENVPNSRNFLREKYTFKMLGLSNKNLKVLGIKKKEQDIALKIDLNPENTLYNSVFYGVPQRRARFICGEFPLPNKKTPLELDWITLGEVIKAVYNKKARFTLDPLYGFSIPTIEITDHFYNTIIPKFDWEQALIKKQQGRYYGKMSFPEDFSKPGRTVLATRSVVTRESIILPNGIPGKFRALTIREAACLMSFPITYLFQAGNESSKYRLVGNAVCPKMISAFAEAILVNENIPIPKVPYIYKTNRENLKVDLRISPPPLKESRNKHPWADFVEIVPDLKLRNFRVELDNNFPKSQEQQIYWNATIHHATGKNNMKNSNPSREEIIKLLSSFLDKKRLKELINYTTRTFRNKIPDLDYFQQQHIEAFHDTAYFSPREALKKVKDIVDFNFPKNLYQETMLLNKKENGEEYVKFNKGVAPNNFIPLRIIVALFCVNYIAFLANTSRKEVRTTSKYMVPIKEKLILKEIPIRDFLRP